MARSRICSIAGITLLISLALPYSVKAQAFTHADSGWVRIFNGTNFNGLYSRLYAAPVVSPADTSVFGIVYPGTDTACIRVKTTSASQRGELGTNKTSYSHYRVRMEYKFDALAMGNNAGLLYGVDETVTRMQNNWPRSIEFQTQQQYTGAAYSIQQVTFTTTASATGQGSAYKTPGGITVQACEIGCNGRWYNANPVLSSGTTQTRWMKLDLIVRGADSAIHIINDTVVLKLWNIRIFNDSTRATGSTASGSNSVSNFTPNGPYTHGGLAVEAEGALVNHRRWEVMEFPLSTPMNENFLHRLVLDNPKQAVKPTGGSTIAIQWRSIGTIPKVKIQYRVGTSGAWQAVTDSTSNTGTYSWTAPGTISDSLRFKISSYDYVVADSTGSTGFTVGIRGMNSPAPSVPFIRDGNGLTFSRLAGFKQVEISDIFGRILRTGAFAGENFRWDLTDSKGLRVSKGLYFVRFKGSESPMTVRVPVF